MCFDSSKITNLYNSSRNKLTEAVPLWALTNPSDAGRPLLLMSQSDEQHFARGIVTYEGTTTLDDLDVVMLMEEYARIDGITDDLVSF